MVMISVRIKQNVTTPFSVSNSAKAATAQFPAAAAGIPAAEETVSAAEASFSKNKAAFSAAQK